jgi:hypothetical protein
MVTKSLVKIIIKYSYPKIDLIFLLGNNVVQLQQGQQCTSLQGLDQYRQQRVVFVVQFYRMNSHLKCTLIRPLMLYLFVVFANIYMYCVRCVDMYVLVSYSSNNFFRIIYKIFKKLVRIYSREDMGL